MQERLYVLIDQNLNPIYGCVQGGHAVAQWIIDHPNQKWNNQYLIYLSANITEWKEKLNLLNRDFFFFLEPDLNNKATAIAITDSGKLFKNLKLISYNGQGFGR